MAKNLDKIVETYRCLSQIPALVGAKLSKNHGTVHSIWSQRNLEKGETTKFLRNITLDSNLSKVGDSYPVDVSKESLSALSPSEQLRAVIRDHETEQFLEIWQNYNLSRVVDLKALDAHGKVYTDVEFGTIQFSPDEKKLIYIAERKIPKSEPFYKRSAQTDFSEGPEKPKGEEFRYRQDWGEQLVGKKQSVIVQYDIESDRVEILEGIPENICPAQVVYSPDGDFFVGVAYETEPRKLGLIYCTNRTSTIFILDRNGLYASFFLQNKSVKSPRFTPDGKSLIWLQRNDGGPHASAMTLMKTTVPIVLPMPKVQVLVDFVKTENTTNDDSKFYGLYNSGFVQRCFASNNRLVLSTNQKNTINTYTINLDSGKITELQYEHGSQIVLDVLDDVILVCRRNFLTPDKLAIGKLGSDGSPKWLELTTGKVIKSLEDCTYEYLDLVQNTNDSVKNFSAIFLGPKSGADKSSHLIVWPHGGPHSAFANSLSLETAVFLSLGYSLLLINYRGSIGAGQDSVEFLPGKIGSSDVSDCILATETALKKYPFINPNKLILVGGSHGGFLVAHLSGQYPDMFKAVVARNPVIDVASMSIISDIPDWCYVEAGFEYTQKGKIEDDVLLAMRKASPIEHAHKVKAPTLLQIGSKDLRVPSHQGIDYYHRLKANKVVVSMNLYDDNHPLGSVRNEMDNIINTVVWIKKYVD